MDKFQNKIKLSTNSIAGRGLIANEKLEIGELILQSEPYTCVLSNTERGKRCDFCFCRNENVKKCSKCKYIYYCNKKCQRQGWNEHRLECSSLQLVAPHQPTDFIRLTAQILHKEKRINSHQSTEELLSIKDIKFMDLQSHLLDLDERKRRSLIQLLPALKLFLRNKNILPYSEHDLLDIFSKLVCNCFSISDEEMKPIGVGIYISASMLNHNCQPNCIAVFNQNLFELRASRIINCGEELNISYIDVLNSKQEKNCMLKDQYNFICHCLLCKDGECQFDSTNYLKSNIETYKVDTIKGKCDNCEMENKPNIVKESMDINLLFKKVEDMKKNKNFSRLFHLCDSSLINLEKAYYLHNILLVKILDATMDAAIECKYWMEAIKYGNKLVSPFSFYYGLYHPLVGLLFFKLGKLLLYVEDYQDALKNLNKGKNILSITHGKENYLFIELTKLIQQCLYEIEFKKS